MRAILATAMIVTLIGWAPPAEAAPRDLLICIPGGAGSTSGAKAYMDPFFRRIESLVRWPAGTIGGSYHPRYGSCLSKIQSSQPGFAVVTLGVYLEQRKRLGLRVIGQVDMFAGAGNRLHLVVKKGSYKSVAQLQGKRLTSNHAEERKFLSKILFGGKIDVSSHFVIRSVNRTLKGPRDVARGRADATIVNDDELRTLRKRSWGANLAVIHSSPRLPGAPFVAFGKWAAGSDTGKLRRIAAKVCRGASAKVCRSAGVKRITPATDAKYRSLARKM